MWRCCCGCCKTCYDLQVLAGELEAAKQQQHRLATSNAALENALHYERKAGQDAKIRDLIEALHMEQVPSAQAQLLQ